MTLIDQLRNPTSSVREYALQQIMHVQLLDELLCGAIVDLLQDREPYLRELAAETLAASNYYSPLQHTRILSALRDVSPIVRAFLLEFLAGYPVIESNLEAGLALLEDDDLRVRIQAANLVWECSKKADLIGDVVATGLRSEDSGCLIATCRLLAKQGDLGLIFNRELSALTQHLSGSVRANALYAISKCSSDKTFLHSLFVEMAQDSDPAVRYLLAKITQL